VTWARGRPSSRRTWPARAVTPAGAVSGARLCHGEYGFPSRHSPVQGPASSATRPVVAVPAPPASARAADASAVAGTPAAGALAAVNATVVNGSASPVAARGPFRVTT
jgi:hypothetical protein